MPVPAGPIEIDGSANWVSTYALNGRSATAGNASESGPAAVFLAVDHFTAECVGIHAAKRGTRREWLIEPHGYQTPSAVRAAFAAQAAA